VDSEHSAIFQCIQGAAGNSIARILLTASGGPFFGMSAQQMRHVTKEQALRHPNWSMGAKITIDSASMMNKGLELIEAMWLYDVEPDDIDIVVHRESIVHSAVEFADGSVIAQMGNPDMRLPIQYALTYPARVPCKVKPLDLPRCHNLTFFAPDEDAFPTLHLARRAAAARGNAGAVLNGANEAAVDLFLHDRIPFYRIAQLVQAAMDSVPYLPDITVDDVLESDRAARGIVYSLVK
jgi:1-deoxy-D-xylulose-5-phosphate reductoisomerase